ncbi:MAG TPA: hypothetical protein VFG30_22335, partial [Polyangiales bacterium]|nr:hypothetical protein [Polyangiales bacterium]
LTKLGLVQGPLAMLPALVAIYFYGRYAIDRKKHTEIQRQLAARHVQQTPNESGQASDRAAGPIEPLPI